MHAVLIASPLSSLINKITRSFRSYQTSFDAAPPNRNGRSEYVGDAAVPAAARALHAHGAAGRRRHRRRGLHPHRDLPVPEQWRQEEDGSR